ncbi:DUF7344 domain-containing protein [Halovivax limisalsi]|uniref:DUF7344 domain-containing protein n=1 Tax=Halovivax limisalsi TaxID=1453760 RepID=UPI001FFD8580|nr:ArsR family transcriptional regulator [Halovivax limisalsi]
MVSRDEPLVRLLSDSTARAVLSTLDDASGGLPVTEIAERIVAEEGGDPDRTPVSLHHNYLPRLEQAGLIEYESETGVATVADGSAIDAEWMDVETLGEVLSQFVSRGQSDRVVGQLEGREAVYTFSRELADRAEDELFLIYASGELLDEECLPYAERALERGVELHAGTKSRSARDFFRNHLPKATVWDPQLDWTYERSSYPEMSRLIMADRETVVVGLWDEGLGGTKTEIAMIGEGKTNPLVVLTRELLGSRIDHLDYQSDDFLGDLPFEG